MTGDPSRREARARGGRSPAEREHHGGDVFLVSAVVVIVSPAPRFSAETANAPAPRVLQAHDAVRRRGRKGGDDVRRQSLLSPTLAAAERS